MSSRPPSISGLAPTSPQASRQVVANHRVTSAPPSQLPSTNVSSDASVRSFQPDISEHPSDDEGDHANHLDVPRRPSPSRRQSSASFLNGSSDGQIDGTGTHSPGPSTERQRSVSRSTVSQSPAVRPPNGSTSRPSPSPAPPRPILQTTSTTGHSPSPGPSSAHPSFPDMSPVRDRDRSESRVRGRQATRFSALSAVLHEIGHEITGITERVRSKSRASPSVGVGGARPFGRGGAGSVVGAGAGVKSVEEGREDGAEGRERGRQKEREKEKEKSTFEKIGASLGLGVESGGEVDGESDMWQEFRKGTYNYPISFAIPSNTLPSLHCDFGSIVYRLKAVVHRTGTFVPKLVAQHEVTLIASPGEDDTEETENIVVERQWDEQLRYFINIAGKSFPIGGVVPITLVMMPLAKVRIYRITVLLEEKIDYYAHGRRVARHDPTRRYELLSLKHHHGTPKHHHYHHEKGNRTPLLPILDEGDMRDSPLLGLVEGADDGESGEGGGDGGASLWNPNGPWTLHLQAYLPTCSSPVHFTCKHAKSNIMISHWIKIMIRVDRGEDQEKDKDKDKEKKRKQFDIIVETPVHLLSCKCNPEYTALPPYTYTSQQQRIGLVSPGECLCDHSRAERQNRVQSPPSTSATAVSSPVATPPSLGFGAFNVPAADFGGGTALRRTSSGPNASAPDRMMGGQYDGHARSATGTGGAGRSGANGASRPGANGGTGGSSGVERPPNARSAESAERLTTLVDRSLQFARLVSGEEGVSGDTPPAYDEAVNGYMGEERRVERGRERGRAGVEERGHVMFTAAAIAESRSASQSRSRPASRPASRPGSRPGSRPNSRPPSIMWP
ncbi:hypothetical protein FRC09_011570 [Ceratobasidium sp. 395]|nr:hypothetical protein FRC09_011570 [Ceratobasidium sp. 395]